MTRPAVFLDRDGTIVEDFNFIGKPEQVKLLPGAAMAIRRLNDSGWPVVVITNQSGIARGYFTEADYERVRERVEELIAAEAGARVDATFVCPHHPDFSGPCECRKPGTLLYRQAAERLDLELAGSWYVGDRMRDVLPAAALGGRGILGPSGETFPEEVQQAREKFEVAPSLDAAVDRILESSR